MSQDLPSCEDFVIEVIRYVRRPLNAQDKAPAGVSIKRVYDVISESPFRDEQYSQAMRNLLNSKKIVLRCSNYRNGSKKTGYSKVVLSEDQIPSWFDFQSQRFYTKYDGEKMHSSFDQGPEEAWSDWCKRIDGIDYAAQLNIIVYVIDDGLPKTMQALLSGSQKKNLTPRSKADAILNEMKD